MNQAAEIYPPLSERELKNAVIAENAAMKRLEEMGVEVRGAIYRLESGKVELL